jgi:hypothetical protein
LFAGWHTHFSGKKSCKTKRVEKLKNKKLQAEIKIKEEILEA